jgi:spore coat polysaccharide biosynthesis protein SpsF
MQSERLPGKVFFKLPNGRGKPLLQWITDTVNNSQLIDDCVVATSENEENDEIIDFCSKHEQKYFRGSEEDVLSRFISVAKTEKANVVIRLTGDNPIIDVTILEKTIKQHIDSSSDYTNTTGLPLGMNFEIISGLALQSVSGDATPDEKEHVTLYFKNRGRYKKKQIDISRFKELAGLRLTVDYPEDYLVVSHVLSNLEGDRLPSLQLVKDVYDHAPWIFQANTDNIQKKVYTSLEEEKKEALQLLRRAGFQKSAEYLEDE